MAIRVSMDDEGEDAASLETRGWAGSLVKEEAGRRMVLALLLLLADADSPAALEEAGAVGNGDELGSTTIGSAVGRAEADSDVDELEVGATLALAGLELTEALLDDAAPGA
jgi:hypothetical protein